MDWNKALATEIAKGLINTGSEGGYDSVAKSTAYDYPSIGVSQWEGNRADELLRAIPGGEEFIGRTYIDIKASGELPMLKELLRSDAGKQAQLDQLSRDCLQYVEVLQHVPTLDDTRCLIYAGMWCPTSTWVVKRFLANRYMHVDLRSLKALNELFKNYYWIAADVGDIYRAGYANRAQTTYEYVAGIDLTTPYGVPAYGEAGNGR
jgi:hypothetical protein|nr:MAG TPA: hypothetical protein [Caudoviricetes sp.]